MIKCKQEIQARRQKKRAPKNFTREDADPEELSKGIVVEMEHTTDKKISEKIALDHLAEIPDYYTRLEKMEKDAGVDVDRLQ